MTHDPQQERRATYLAHRDHLRDSAADQTASQDKALSFLASGALTLSVTFVNNLSAGAVPVHKEWIFGGWVALAISLFASLFSFWTATEDFRLELSRTDKDYRAGEGAPKHGPNLWRWATTALNVVAILALCVGSAAVLWFVWVNLPEVGSVAKSDSPPVSDKQQINEGNRSVPPPLPAPKPAPATPPKDDSKK